MIADFEQIKELVEQGQMRIFRTRNFRIDECRTVQFDQRNRNARVETHAKRIRKELECQK